MDAFRGRALDPLIIGAAAIGIVAVVWLAPLMSDQLVLFGDQEQTRQAAASRQAMLPAAALLLLAAGLLTQRLRLHALLTALPALVAVPVALLAPENLYQLLAYAVLGPISLGALLSAAIPPPRSVRVPVIVLVAVLLLALTILASPLTIMVLVALIVWWRLPQEDLAIPGVSRSALD
jgi:hypothetical protein